MLFNKVNNSRLIIMKMWGIKYIAGIPPAGLVENILLSRISDVCRIDFLLPEINLAWLMERQTISPGTLLRMSSVWFQAQPSTSDWLFELGKTQYEVLWKEDNTSFQENYVLMTSIIFIWEARMFHRLNIHPQFNYFL